MDNTLEIRKMRSSDLPDILDIQEACYTQVAPESLKSLQAKLSAFPSTCFVATLHGETIAYLISLFCDFSHPPELNSEVCNPHASPDCLYLHDLAVSPSARNTGAGRALVNRFLEVFQESGLKRASLIAVQHSESYWNRFGFCAVVPSGLLKEKISTYGDSVKYMAWSAEDI